VSQRPDGTWDVIDGLQRLSTILQLTGDLKDVDGRTVEPLVLEKTRYLPDLEGKTWDAPYPEQELPQSAKLKIKRARLDLKIVLNTSDPSAKYELFQRLNTGGSLATDQEVRNCLLIMLNPKFFEWISSLAEDENFKLSAPLSERAMEERYDLELVVRFLVLRTLPDDRLNQVGDLGPFLTDRVVEFAESKTFDPKTEERAFRRTFELLASTLGDDAFKKFDPDKGRALGPLLISVFELMALGIGFHAHKRSYKVTSQAITEVHHSLWSIDEFRSSTGSGIRAAARIQLHRGRSERPDPPSRRFAAHSCSPSGCRVLLRGPRGGGSDVCGRRHRYRIQSLVSGSPRSARDDWPTVRHEVEQHRTLTRWKSPKDAERCRARRTDRH
jgi:hypothetical protein